MTIDTTAFQPLRVRDVTVRDGSQSLNAGRIRNDDAVRIVSRLSPVGFCGFEGWGGAVVDIGYTFLGEDAIKNARSRKEAAPDLWQSMLVRGQSGVGYKNYADDIIRLLMRVSAKNGIDVARIFDGLDYLPNMETAAREGRAQGMHIQGTMCYTNSPVHNVDYFLNFAKKLEASGLFDSLCIKDPSGSMPPQVASELFPGLKRETCLPYTLHMHGGMGYTHATVPIAVIAGIDDIDTGQDAMSGGASHISIEELIYILRNHENPIARARMPVLDEAALKAANREVLRSRAKYVNDEWQYNLRELEGQRRIEAPGGGWTPFMKGFKREVATARLNHDEIFEKVATEVPRIHRDFGYPCKVTPHFQIIGTQAIRNVIARYMDPKRRDLTDAQLEVMQDRRRYAPLSNESQHLLTGWYGQTVGERNPDLIKYAIEKRIRPDLKIITDRPANHLEPGIPMAVRRLEQEAGIRNPTDEQVLIVGMFDDRGLKFLLNEKTPEKIPTYEPPPQVRKYFLSAGFERKTFGDVQQALEDIIENMAQIALKRTMLATGFYREVSEEHIKGQWAFLDGKLQEDLKEIPVRLREAGFTETQINGAFYKAVEGPVRIANFNTKVKERALALGADPRFIPQVEYKDLKFKPEAAVSRDVSMDNGQEPGNESVLAATANLG